MTPTDAVTSKFYSSIHSFGSQANDPDSANNTSFRGFFRSLMIDLDSAHETCCNSYLSFFRSLMNDPDSAHETSSTSSLGLVTNESDIAHESSSTGSLGSQTNDPDIGHEISSTSFLGSLTDDPDSAHGNLVNRFLGSLLNDLDSAHETYSTGGFSFLGYRANGHCLDNFSAAHASSTAGFDFPDRIWTPYFYSDSAALASYSTGGLGSHGLLINHTYLDSATRAALRAQALESYIQQASSQGHLGSSSDQSLSGSATGAWFAGGSIS